MSNREGIGSAQAEGQSKTGAGERYTGVGSCKGGKTVNGAKYMQQGDQLPTGLVIAFLISSTDSVRLVTAFLISSTDCCSFFPDFCSFFPDFCSAACATAFLARRFFSLRRYCLTLSTATTILASEA